MYYTYTDATLDPAFRDRGRTRILRRGPDLLSKPYGFEGPRPVWSIWVYRIPIPGPSKGCPMDYPTLPIGFHWAPLRGSWYTYDPFRTEPVRYLSGPHPRPPSMSQSQYLPAHCTSGSDVQWIPIYQQRLKNPIAHSICTTTGS